MSGVPPDWAELGRRLAAATGTDADLDLALSKAGGGEAGDYTSSVTASRALIARLLPGWTVHLGFDASGVFPYVALGNGPRHVAAGGPTLPLALLRALAAALAPADPGRSAPPDA
jgi:hypothetical protein